MYSFVVTNICTNMNERERVLAIKGGDHQAFIDLYNEYWVRFMTLADCTSLQLLMQRKLFRMCLWSCGNQGIYWRKMKISKVFFIVTRNIVFNKNKKRVNENLFKTSVLVAYGNEGYYNSTTVEEDYCASQLKIFIDRLINSLPEQQRKCFLLSREESLSYKEIAERLGISQKTVEIHMGKALKFLKDKVKRGWEILLSLLSF